MMAVTKVNGCAVCSYAHSKMAFKEGMPADEVQLFIIGDPRFIQKEEAIAIAFAQRYVDTKDMVDRLAYERVLNIYVPEKTKSHCSGYSDEDAGQYCWYAHQCLAGSHKGTKRNWKHLLYELDLPLSAFLF